MRKYHQKQKKIFLELFQEVKFYPSGNSFYTSTARNAYDKYHFCAWDYFLLRLYNLYLLIFRNYISGTIFLLAL